MKIMTGIFAFVIFACIGSFIGVCYDRIPKGEKVWKGRSHCDVCGRTLGVRELIPIISFICLKGRCRKCKGKISIASTLIEIFTAVIGTLAVIVYGPTVQGIVFGFAACILFEIALLDQKTLDIADMACLLVALCGAVLTVVNGSYISSLIGMVCVSLPFLVITLLGGMGMGDVKLMCAVGILLGWQQTLLAAFFGVVIGGAAALILKISNKKGRKSEIPFGPYLCVGTYLSMLIGPQCIAVYLSLL